MTQMNLSNKQKQAHRHREQLVVTKGARSRGGMELGARRHKLFRREGINNMSYYITQRGIFNILLLTIMEQNIKNECICVYNSVPLLSSKN